MKRLLAGTAALVTLAVAIPFAVNADQHGGHGMDGKREHHGMGHHGKGQQGMGHHGMGQQGMGHHGKHGGKHGGKHAKIRMLEMIAIYDADGDGSITQEEVDKFRADRLAAFDADKNGQLSLDEYERLWLDAMREQMVDQFQAHDGDGDGQVTVEEFAKREAYMVMKRDKNEDGVLNLDDLGRGYGHGRHHGERAAPEGQQQ